MENYCEKQTRRSILQTIFLVLALYILRVVSKSSTCSTTSSIPCHVQFGYVYFNFDNLTSTLGNERLVFQATNIAENATTNYYHTKYSRNEFQLWDVFEMQGGSRYKLSLVSETSKEVMWSHKETFKIHQVRPNSNGILTFPLPTVIPPSEIFYSLTNVCNVFTLD